MSRPQNTYFIGIDLGTSNSLCSYIENSEPETLSITQPRDLESIVTQELLPSFCILPDKKISISEASLPEPANDWIPGEFAKRQSLHDSERIIHSAKSWLSVSTIERTSAILPWNSPIQESYKLSPVEVQSTYLSYIRKTFEHTISPQSFANAHITITVPASFDEEACHLTKMAALQAGFPDNTVFLDEPQAALFANIDTLSRSFKNNKPERPLILICDVGGGTTDFSIYSYSKEKEVPFERVKIGRHLLLGGDNIDAAIAHYIKDSQNLDLTDEEFRLLIQEARTLKEEYFNSPQLPQTARISIAGKGAHLFKSSKTIEIPLQEILSFVSHGFFPSSGMVHKKRNAAEYSNEISISDFGLPLEHEPAITHHLYEFLEGLSVDAILFNGGTMECPVFRERILSFIDSLQGYPPREIPSASLTHSVSKGAASYLHARQGGKNLVKAGYPRNLYLLAEDHTTTPKAVCILEKGEERDEWISISNCEFSLLLDTECNFTLLSRTNAYDTPGSIHTPDDSFQVLSRLATVISTSEDKDKDSKRIRVSLDVKISSLRIIEIRLKETSTTKSFPLLFKGGSNNLLPPPSSTVHGKLPDEVPELITILYGNRQKKTTDITPQNLIRKIEQALSLDKGDWDTHILRNIADLLIPFSSKRSRSSAHEITWLHLCGFCLRPGFGAENDERRLSEIEKTRTLGLFFKKEKNAQTAWAIFWRRISGGLNPILQEELFHETLAYVKKNKFLDPEHIRLLCCMEQIPVENKINLLETLYKRCSSRSNPSEAELWGIARLISRHSISQNDAHLLSSEIAADYTDKAISSITLDKNKTRYFLRILLLSQMERGDEYDIPLAIREKLNRTAAKFNVDAVEKNDNTFSPQSFLHGESLPIGIRINEQE